MNTKILPPTTLLDDLHPSRFLKPADLLERWKITEIIVTVAEVRMEQVEPKPGQKEDKPVLYFKTKTGQVFSRGYLLGSKIDTESLKSSTAATTIGELIGKQIKIIVSEYRDNVVLRIDPKPV